MERSRSKDHPMLEGQHHVRYAGTHDTTETNVLGGEIGRFASTIHSFKDEESSNDSSARHLPSFQRRKPTMIRSNRQSLGFFRHVGYLVAIITSICITPTSAVLVEFQNCLSNSYRNDAPLKLQLVPMFVNAVFNSTDSSHNLNVTVYTNVTGSTTGQVQYVLPPSNDTAYWTSNDTTAGGKIEDNPFPETVAKYTTLTNKVDVLTYTPYSHDYSFCTVLAENGYSCPLAPVFNVTGSNPRDLPSFGFSNNFYSTYAFTSFTATLQIKYGDESATAVGCISANITPDIGTTLSAVVRYIPVIILVCVAFATAFAAIYSPWGSTDIFRWTTNYGRDADLLRLVTPGFGDCLQYIQFVALTGGLTLNYPGFYQPIVSKVAWSTLMFNQSFVSHTYSNTLVDGIYVTNGTYGLDKYRQLVGMGEVEDVWAGMMIWLLVIIAAVLVFIQLGFMVRWLYRTFNDTQEEDLRNKNWPFSGGNAIRIIFSYFLLPIVSLSMFQLVVASKSPYSVIVPAVIVLVLIMIYAAWFLRTIASARPKSFLFDDLPTLLLYGSLYNTYSDNAAPFALIPIFLTFLRGVAIGAIQPSGIAQLVVLAICEVITVLTLHAFRPFHSPTSMNAFHTFFSALRFATVLLMIAFAPSLGVTEGPKGWIGYAILLMHAIVLICGFLLNALQTVVEVSARLAGAGGDEHGATRGGLSKVFGMRQLSRRLPRDNPNGQTRLSTAMFDAENDRKSYILDQGRMRSQSAGSAGILLHRHSVGLDSLDAYGATPSHHLPSAQGSYTPTTPGETSMFSFLPSAAAPSGQVRNRGPILGLAAAEAADPYYRPPRFRRPTLETNTPGSRSRASWIEGDWGSKRMSQVDMGSPDEFEQGPPFPGRDTPVQLALDGSPPDRRGTPADYTTREVDFYYGVRGPALNANTPNRRIKTGPADPTGPAASAAGWFKGLFGGKTKEKGKGFEVVRSSRMPPGSRNRLGGESPPEGVPEVIPAATGATHGPIDSDDESPVCAGPSVLPPLDTTVGTAVSGHPVEDPLVRPLGSDDESNEEYDHYNTSRVSEFPPTLSGLNIPGGGIELPSRFPSKATSRGSQRVRATDTALMPEMPNRIGSSPSLPRKSSRRKSQNTSVDLTKQGPFLHRVEGSISSSSRMPFERTNSKKRQSDISTRSGVTDIDLGPSGSVSSAHRPTSLGRVNRTIQTVTPTENQQHFGSSAELFDAGRSGASSMEFDRHVDDRL